jgi:anti-anti-sigma factor
MNSDLKITSEVVERNGKSAVTVLHLRGWLDAQSEPQLLDAAQTAKSGGAIYLVLDMAEVDTLTSAGMRAIQKVYKLITPPDQHFKVAYVKLCNAPPQIYHVLGITGFLHNTPMYESLDAALESYE